MRRSSGSTSSGTTISQGALPAGQNATAVRSNTNVTRRGLGTVTEQNKAATQPASGPSGQGGSGNVAPRYDDFRINNHNVERIPPRERDYRPYSDPGRFYGPNPHYFGWRIETLPPRYRKVRYFGIDYYLYNDVYYRPFGGHYVVCRPPVGIILDRAIRDLVLAPVRFAYYHDAYRVYSGWDSYSRYIDEQNRIIAQNNATIARQNSLIAMNLSTASSAYDVASRLGLAQSYAYADKEYYYDDGVFYIINDKGRYQTITPPAGALVEELPDDYDTLTLGGTEYYRVDDTVYRVVMVSGHPYLEVLGQMYGTLASRYNIYK